MARRMISCDASFLDGVAHLAACVGEEVVAQEMERAQCSFHAELRALLLAMDFAKKNPSEVRTVFRSDCKPMVNHATKKSAKKRLKVNKRMRSDYERVWEYLDSRPDWSVAWQPRLRLLHAHSAAKRARLGGVRAPG